jgi:hypothetical protein
VESTLERVSALGTVRLVVTQLRTPPETAARKRSALAPDGNPDLFNCGNPIAFAAIGGFLAMIGVIYFAFGLTIHDPLFFLAWGLYWGPVLWLLWPRMQPPQRGGYGGNGSQSSSKSRGSTARIGDSLVGRSGAADITPPPDLR